MLRSERTEGSITAVDFLKAQNLSEKQHNAEVKLEPHSVPLTFSMGFTDRAALMWHKKELIKKTKAWYAAITSQ